MSVPVDHLRDSGPQRPAGTGSTHVGHWRLQSRLGEGGMGVVHLAAGPDGSRVALKVMRPHVVSDAESRERLAREVALLGRVRSPRVAEIIDADPWHEVPWVATRYVPGWSLHEHVRAEGPITGRDLRWFARCLAEALVAVHATGVVHRDLKPANVLLEGRSPVLIDFGLARLAEDTRLTRAGFVMGTPGYLAPEVLLGGEATPAADVHAFGACLAYAATGVAPFGSGPAVAVMDRVRRGEHDLSGLDEGIRPMVTACLDPDPARRPDAGTLLSALLAVPDTEAAAHAPVKAPGRAATTAAAAAAPPAGPTVPLALSGLTSRLRTAGDAVRTAVVAPTPGAPATRVLPAQRPVSTSHPRVPVGPRPHGGPRPPHPPPYRQHPVTPAPATSPERHPRPVGRVEAGALAASLRVGLLALVVTAFVAAPWVATGLVLAAAHVLRTWSWTDQSRREKVLRRGRTRWHDGPAALAVSPWYAVVALGGTTLLAVWVALALGTVAAVAWLLALPTTTALLAGGVTLALAGVTGPGSGRVRRTLDRGSRRTGSSRVVAVGVLVVLAVAVALLASGAAAGPTLEPFGPLLDVTR